MSDRKTGFSWNRVIASGMEGMALGNAFCRKKQALYDTMPADGLISVLGTGGVKAARRP